MEKEARTYVQDIKRGQVFLQGWVHELRDLPNIKFILLRDATGVVQCVVKDKDLVKIFSQLTVESVISVKGDVRTAIVKSPEVTNKSAEVEIKAISIVNKAEALPMTVMSKGIETALPTRLDYRSIDLRKPRTRAIFVIQSEIANSFHKFLYDNKFIEIQSPDIIASASEGGTELFEVKYFEKKAYLAQSPQLYKQLAAIALEKVFCLVPVWRAEKHNTTRHLNESRQMDIEMAFADDFHVMSILEKCVQFIVSSVIKNCAAELEILGLKLKVPKAVYLSYEEAIKKVNGKLGEDFDQEQEKKLCNLYPDSIIFTHSWPIKLKPFYIWPKDEKKKVSGGFDALYGGIEISSGGQRVHKADVLARQLKDKGLNPKNFESYINAFKYGAPYHSGWSIGLERFTMALLGLDNIREACMFPRDRERLTP